MRLVACLLVAVLAAGCAPKSKPTTPQTLDLRIDYLKAATPGREIFGGAACYKLGHELAFVRGGAYHDTPDDPIATSSAIFMFTGGPVSALDDALSALQENRL